MYNRAKLINGTIRRLCILAAFAAASPLLSQETDAVSGSDEEAIELTEEIEYIDDENGLEKMPEIIEFVEAEYPQELIKDGIEGTVLFELLVNETGGVDSVSVIRPLHPQLDSSAVKAVRQFKFSPAQLTSGENVAVMLQYEYRFTLKEVITVPESYVNLAGRILERGTRKPVAEALIAARFTDTLCGADLPMPFSLYMEQTGKLDGQTWEEGHIITETDADGYFQFQSLPACKVQISLVLPDYEPFITEEQIGRLEEVKVTYYVKRTDYTDYEFVVYGKAEEKEVSRRQLTITEVKKIPGLGGDAVKVVQAMPGVGRASFGGTEVAVRGAPGWDSKYFIDGISTPLLYHMGGLNSIYPSEALEALDFYPGGFSTRYGGVVGGVIELRGRKPKTDRLQGHVDLSMLNGALFLEGPITPKVSFIASARRNFAGDLVNLYFKHADPDKVPFGMAVFCWDYLLRTDIKINKDHSMFVSLMGSRDSMGIFMPGMDSGTDEIDGQLDKLGMKMLFHTFTVGLDSRLNDKWTNSARLSGSYGQSDFSVFGMVKVEETPYLSYLRNQLSYKASDNATINFGADMEFINENMILILNSGQNLIQRDTSENWWFGVMGGYLNVEWKPTEKLLLIPGIRYDYFPELDYSGSLIPAFWDYGIMDNRRGGSGEPSFRVNARYELTEEHTIKGAAGSYSQTPKPLGQVIHEKWGDPKLPATKAAHYVAGYEWQINDMLNLDAQAYLNRQWDIPRQYDDRIDYDPNLQKQKMYLSDGRGRMYGLELMLRHTRSDKFFGWVSYTISRSEAWSKFDGKYVLSPQDEPHHLQLLGSWYLPRNWGVGVRTRFVSGKPDTPIIGIMEHADSKYIEPVYGEENSSRMDPFFQVDLRVDKKVIYNKWILSYYLDLQNILWPLYKSPEMVFYNYNYTEKQSISMIPLIAFGVRAEF